MRTSVDFGKPAWLRLAFGLWLAVWGWCGAVSAGEVQDVRIQAAEHGILAVPHSVDDLEYLLGMRIQELRAAGRPEEALVDAKRLFLVSSMAHTGQALKMVERCLKAVAASRGEAGAETQRRFRQEQRTGAAEAAGKEVSATLAELLARPGARSAVLDAIQIPPEPYLTAAAGFDGTDEASLTARGNLLLLAGRPREAQKVFDALLQGTDAADLRGYFENVARTVKAEDGTIGRANAYARMAAKEL